jgi:hypothetical protein
MRWRPGGTRSAIACDPANLDSVIETTRPLCRLDQCLKADQPGAGTTATKRLQGARWCGVEPHFRINHVGHGAPINSAIDCFYKCHFLLAVKALVRCSSAFDQIPDVSKHLAFIGGNRPRHHPYWKCMQEESDSPNRGIAIDSQDQYLELRCNHQSARASIR